MQITDTERVARYGQCLLVDERHRTDRQCLAVNGRSATRRRDVDAVQTAARYRIRDCTHRENPVGHAGLERHVGVGRGSCSVEGKCGDRCLPLWDDGQGHQRERLRKPHIGQGHRVGAVVDRELIVEHALGAGKAAGRNGQSVGKFLEQSGLSVGDLDIDEPDTARARSSDDVDNVCPGSRRECRLPRGCQSGARSAARQVQCDRAAAVGDLKSDGAQWRRRRESRSRVRKGDSQDSGICGID